MSHNKDWKVGVRESYYPLLLIVIIHCLPTWATTLLPSPAGPILHPEVEDQTLTCRPLSIVHPTPTQSPRLPEVNPRHRGSDTSILLSGPSLQS